MNISHLQLSVISLVFMALYTFVLCSVRTHKFVVKEGLFIFGLASLLWLAQLVNGIVWVTQTSAEYFWCLLFWQFIPSVFLFGIATIVSQDPTVTDYIVIREGSVLAKIIDFLPSTKGKSSLCSFSWANTFLIFGLPVFGILIGGFVALVCVLLSLFLFRSPLEIGKSLLSDYEEHNKPVKYRRFKNNLPISPFVYLVPVIGIWGIVTNIHKPDMGQTILWLIYLGIVALVYIVVGVLVANAIREEQDKEPIEMAKPFAFGIALLTSVKGTICPRIRIS